MPDNQNMLIFVLLPPARTGFPNRKNSMEELFIILSGTWKFAATFPVAIYLFKMSFFETILYTNLGGLAGIAIFTLISNGFLRVFAFLIPVIKTNTGKPKKVFTRRNRRLVALKKKYGMTGIIVLTPVLLSIPVGVFLNTKYYGQRKISYLYLFLGQVVWSFIFTIIYTQAKIAF